jgi:hypothetical protein
MAWGKFRVKRHSNFRIWKPYLFGPFQWKFNGFGFQLFYDAFSTSNIMWVNWRDDWISIEKQKKAIRDPF